MPDSSPWPKVLAADKLRCGACIYCHRAVGLEHSKECTTVTKRVRVRYTVEVDITVPHAWDAGMVVFHRTDSSWCQDGVVQDLDEHRKALDAKGSCFCRNAPPVKTEFVRVVDETPRRHK